MNFITWACLRCVQELVTIFDLKTALRDTVGCFQHISDLYLSFFNRPQFKNVKLASHIFCSQVDIIRSWSCNDVMMMIVSNAITV